METPNAPRTHELRNCLATLRLTLEYLQRRPEHCSSKGGLIDGAERSLDRIFAVVRDETTTA
jgi:hypothetical protein